MSGIIECRTCSEPKCDECNLFILSQMLREGNLNALMDYHRTIVPAVDVRPNVRGEWEYIECVVGSIHINFPGCSVCKRTFMIPMDSAKSEFKYCPNCGADMRSEEEGR